MRIPKRYWRWYHWIALIIAILMLWGIASRAESTHSAEAVETGRVTQNHLELAENINPVDIATHYEATAYCLTGITATGTQAGRGSIAVDPRVIPLGSKLRIEGYGEGVAVDTGGAINGHIIDVWLPCDKATQWGRRNIKVEIL